ncbi:MAG: YlxR family protein [Actinobacteria bacterium]|nr:MAG: YlxR family protein [Actinomycetota bacterium]
MSAPIRSCVGCGRKASQRELLRFVADGARLVPADGRGGRSAYTCRRLACFERAATRRAFSRTLRRTVQVDQRLCALYT